MHLEPGESRDVPAGGGVSLHDQEPVLDAVLEAGGLHADEGVDGEGEAEAGAVGQLPELPQSGPAAWEGEVPHVGLPAVVHQQQPPLHRRPRPPRPARQPPYVAYRKTS